MTAEKKSVGIILFDGCDLMDMAGPADVFATANRKAGAAYGILYLSLDGGPTRTWEGATIDTVALGAVDARSLDTVILTGGLFEDRRCDPRLVEWVARNYQHVRRIASVCTGAFFLAQAGLLDGRRATTHWEDCGALQERFPGVAVDMDSIFVRDGPVWTSAGITAGIDMALAMVEEDHGREVAMAVARNLVVFLKRPGGQSQFSTHLECQVMEGSMSPLLKWIIENPAADLRAETMAERAGMSLRNFYRAFEETTGTSPAEWVEAVRLGLARRMLEQTEERIDQIARRSGFVTYERMRRCFARRLGVTPADYRLRFAQTSPRPSGEVDVSVLLDAFGLDLEARRSLQ